MVHARIGKGWAFKVIFRARRAVRYAVFAQHARTISRLPLQRQDVSPGPSRAREAGPGSQRLSVRSFCSSGGLRALGYPRGQRPRSGPASSA